MRKLMSAVAFMAGCGAPILAHADVGFTTVRPMAGSVWTVAGTVVANPPTAGTTIFQATGTAVFVSPRGDPSWGFTVTGFVRLNTTTTATGAFLSGTILSDSNGSQTGTVWGLFTYVLNNIKSMTMGYLLNSTTTSVVTVGPAGTPASMSSTAMTVSVAQPANNPFSVSKTGDVTYAFLYTASNTGTALYVRGAMKISMTITLTGGNQCVTLFIDASNNDSAPNVNDYTAWSTLTPNGVIMQGTTGTLCSVCGSVQANTVSVATGYKWIKVRLEGINGTTSVTGFVLAIQ